MIDGETENIVCVSAMRSDQSGLHGAMSKLRLLELDGRND
jgi:hypothetical protein